MNSKYLQNRLPLKCISPIKQDKSKTHNTTQRSVLHFAKVTTTGKYGQHSLSSFFILCAKIKYGEIHMQEGKMRNLRCFNASNVNEKERMTRKESMYITGRNLIKFQVDDDKLSI